MNYDDECKYCGKEILEGKFCSRKCQDADKRKKPREIKKYTAKQEKIRKKEFF